MYAAMRKSILALLLLCCFTAYAAETRGLKLIAVDAATQKTGEVELYRKSVAVIIGIDQYANLPADKQLTYAVRDAQGVADVLKRQYKFDQIITLYNKDATRKIITKLLEVDFPKQMGEQDALFIFWAGHGNQESSREGDIGYLMPHDGRVDDITTNLTMSEIRDTISKKIPAKHIFYVMDACYSGLLTETRSVDKTPRRDLAYLQDITKERVRQVLTAGGKNQEVLDGGANGHSVFTGRLIELLEKTGDFITANEIQAIIKEKVNGDARARNHPQTPSYGTLYGTGDFVFIPSLEQKVADNQAEIAKLEAELERQAAEAKLKAEWMKSEHLTMEQKKREAESVERKRLLTAKTEDEKRLAELKIAADARRKNDAALDAEDFPSLESAVAEIKRLNQQINRIEAGYEKTLVQTRKQVQVRYAMQIAALDVELKDEFETAADFKTKQENLRQDLIRLRNAELSQLNAKDLAAAETLSLRRSVQQLAEREYTVGAESLVAELGSYHAETERFVVSIRSQTPLIKLAMNATIPLPLVKAKLFKQQWMSGLVRVEGNVKLGSDDIKLDLVNDADNVRLSYENGEFMTSKMRQERESEETIERTYRGELVKIPATKSFLLGKTEVTQAQWRAVMGNNPSYFSSCGESCPVEQVSWDDIQLFLQKLNAKTGKYYRLPTESEWEFACYGGSQTEYCGGNNIGSVAWYAGNSGDTLHLVGQKQANGYGLYDMSGNVLEWTQDCSNGDCGWHVLRGGSLYGSAYGLRATYRYLDLAGHSNTNYGFRLARTLP